MRTFGTSSGGGVELATLVSCGKYFKADIGTLSLSAGRLTFETKGTRLLDVSLESIEKITWHWYSFSGAFEARIAGVNYFLSFVPRNSGLSSWHDGLTIGRQWRAALEGRPMPKGPPLGARIFLLVINLFLVFFLICFLIVTLGAAVDPHQTTNLRILSGVSSPRVPDAGDTSLAWSASPPARLITTWKQGTYIAFRHVLPGLDNLPGGSSHRKLFF